MKITTATFNPDYSEYEQMIAKLIEINQSKPALTVEGPKSSSKANESVAPPVVTSLPILLPQEEILILQPINTVISESLLILEKNNEAQKKVEAKNSKKSTNRYCHLQKKLSLIKIKAT